MKKEPRLKKVRSLKLGKETLRSLETPELHGVIAGIASFSNPTCCWACPPL